MIWNDEDAARHPESYWTYKASKQELHDFALGKSKELDPKLTKIIRLTKVDDIVKTPLVIKGLVLNKSGGMRNSRITLLGDAAHPMTPCKSERKISSSLKVLEGGTDAP